RRDAALLRPLARRASGRRARPVRRQRHDGPRRAVPVAAGDPDRPEHRLPGPSAAAQPRRPGGLVMLRPGAYDVATMTTREKLYTVPETALELDLHPGTVRRQIANGRLEASKLGRDLVVTQSAIDRYRRDR